MLLFKAVAALLSSMSSSSPWKMKLIILQLAEGSQLQVPSQVSRGKASRSTQSSGAREIQSLGKVPSVATPNKEFQGTSIVDLATPPAHVSPFCQAVIKNLLPNDFLGKDDVLEHNQNLLLHKVDHFIRLRRFESMSLHEVMQDMKVIYNGNIFHILLTSFL